MEDREIDNGACVRILFYFTTDYTEEHRLDTDELSPQPTTTYHNQQQLTTTNNNQPQPTTTYHNQQQLTITYYNLP
jgi:endonuclease I